MRIASDNCPACGSTNVQLGLVEWYINKPMMYFQTAKCHDCGCSWTNRWDRSDERAKAVAGGGSK